jgi:hypothetical protein
MSAAENGVDISRVGQRAWHMDQARKLESRLGFSTSNFVISSSQLFEEMFIDDGNFDVREAIRFVDESSTGFRSPHPDVVTYFEEKVLPYKADLRAITESLNGERVIVRASPIDEASRSELSFAGVYKGYMPLGSHTREDDLITGTATMLAGRFTKHGNAYYERHGIRGDRKVGALFMEPFFDLVHDTPLFYGTAYVVDGHIRNEYHIKPPADQPQRDPRLMVKRANNVWHDEADQTVENSIDFDERMIHVLEGLNAHFRTSLDVEYIIDPKGDIYVVQLRKLSARHADRWTSLPHIEEGALRHNSAIINSIGKTAGKIIDLREDASNVDAQDYDKGIIVINHEPTLNGLDSERLFVIASQQKLSNLRVIVDHGTSRRRDHLQFALAEDPGIDFIVQTTDTNVTHKLSDNELVEVSSNGIVANVKRIG